MKKKKEKNKARFHSDSYKTALKSKKLIEKFLSIKEELEQSGVTFDELLRIVAEKEKQRKEQLPLNIFQTNKLSALEAIVKYLKETIELPNREIAQLLNRDQRTVWSTYHNAVKKLPEAFVLKESKLNIPVSLFRERKLSVLETIVVFLKKGYGMSYHQIAVLLRRDDRTVWTVFNRAKEKEKKHEKDR